MLISLLKVGSIAAARLADWTYDAANAAKSFANWAKDAGQLPNDMGKVFNVFNKPENEKLLPGGKFEAPKGIPKGSGKAGDKGDPNPANPPAKPDPAKPDPKQPDPKQPGPKQPDPKQPDPKKPDPKKNKSCKKQKRNPKGKGMLLLSCLLQIFPEGRHS